MSTHLHSAWNQRIVAGSLEDALEGLAQSILSAPYKDDGPSLQDLATDQYGGYIYEDRSGRLMLEGKPIQKLYRVVDPGEWKVAQDRGYLQSWEKYTRASVKPDERWRYQGDVGVRGYTLEIDYNPTDDWHASAEGYAATRNQIPLSRVRKMGSKIAKSIPPLPDWAWEDQAGQYPQSGPANEITYFKGVINSDWYVDNLLAFDDGSQLCGILQHFPQDMGPERKGNINVLVDPAMQRKGIGQELLHEALSRWNIDLQKQDLTPSGKRLIDRFLKGGSKTAGVTVSPRSPLSYNQYRVNERISIIEGGSYYSGVMNLQENLDKGYKKWRADNPGRNRPDRFKDVTMWAPIGYSYFTPSNSQPGEVAFIDLQVQGNYVDVAYLTVRPDRAGHGLARQLFQEVYDRHPDAKVHWGKMMQESIGHLYKDFQKRYPDRTVGGSVYY